MAYRLLSNWLPTGTCCAEIASRSAWMVAWLIVSLKTQTLGPNTPFAPGHSDVPWSATVLIAGLAADAGVALAETAAIPAAAAKPALTASTVSSRARRLRGTAFGSGVLCIGIPASFVDPPAFLPREH